LVFHSSALSPCQSHGSVLTTSVFAILHLPLIVVHYLRLPLCPAVIAATAQSVK